MRAGSGWPPGWAGLPPACRLLREIVFVNSLISRDIFFGLRRLSAALKSA
jgi:hypothetical protein